ncbi:MAG: hypothetical protein HDT43_04830 [Ruminococcaceae bacterium]|nr:hypothetical protein [Oscillospiraceae bacterium]
MGFVKISDDLPSWAWYADNNTLLVYIRLLLGAAWRDTDYQNITLQRGQIATTLPKIAQENGITERQARTILDRLKSTGKVSVKTTSKFSVITLLDYDCAVENVSQVDCQMTDERQTARQSNVRPTLLYTELQNSREQNARASGFNEVKRSFNEICRSLPPLEKDLTITQVRLIETARVNLRGSSFEDFFKRVEKSDFLCGRTGGSFKATFEWILKPENMMKICSGQYDHNYKQAPQNPPEQKSWNDYTPEELAEQAKHFYD